MVGRCDAFRCSAPSRWERSTFGDRNFRWSNGPSQNVSRLQAQTQIRRRNPHNDRSFHRCGSRCGRLITVRAQRIIAASPVCLYAGSLVPAELLEWCPVGAQVVDTARLSLDEITAILVEADSAGLDVARLHSGDPSIFSAVAEQARRLDAAGVDFDMIPGVPAFTAAAAALGGRELTVPGVSQTIVLTRVSTLSTAMPEGEDLRSLGRSGATMVIHLGAHRIEQIASELADNYGEDCPVAVVAFASRPEEIVVRGTLKTIVELVHAAGITKTAVVIVGRVLTAEGVSGQLPLLGSAREKHTLTSTGTRRRVLLLGGTGEGRVIASRLAGSADLEVVTSLAGRVRDPRWPEGGEVRIGGFGGEPKGCRSGCRPMIFVQCSTPRIRLPLASPRMRSKRALRIPCRTPCTDARPGASNSVTLGFRHTISITPQSWCRRSAHALF